MGGFFYLLTLPVSGPVLAGRWVLEQIRDVAEAEYYDENKIVADLQAISGALEDGLMSPEAHAAAEARLLERLREARARKDPHREEW